MTKAKHFAGALKRRATEDQVAGGRSEAGDTLVEILIAMVILGISGTAILGAFTTAIAGSGEHRTLATLDTVLRSYAETATYQIQLQPTGALFSACATSYSITTPSPPSGYSVAISSIKYWSSSTSTWTTTGCSASANAPELITATATGPGNLSDSLAFVVTNPLFV